MLGEIFPNGPMCETGDNLFKKAGNGKQKVCHKHI